MKIAIIGNAGSGKSTLGFELHKKLGILLYHLDQYQWKPHYERVDRDEFEYAFGELLSVQYSIGAKLFPVIQKDASNIFLRVSF